ncbi:hypothetical protein, partial [Actinomadura alba]|uniref:hypothetical protein n=2 Tax=Actinomadura alba TaxID=406431 RepID=UPI0031D43E81
MTAAAIVVIAAIVGVATWPRDDDGREARGTSASPRLITAAEVDSCSLLTDRQVRGLIPEAERRTTDTGECAWWNRLVDGYLSVLPVEIRVSREEAHDQMAIRWNNAGSASAATGKRATTEWTAPAPLFLTVEGIAVPPARVPGVGDEAYSTGIRGSGEEFDCTTLRVRVPAKSRSVRFRYAGLMPRVVR